jgi:hypothetical protein
MAATEAAASRRAAAEPTPRAVAASKYARAAAMDQIRADRHRATTRQLIDQANAYIGGTETAARAPATGLAPKPAATSDDERLQRARERAYLEGRGTFRLVRRGRRR